MAIADTITSMQNHTSNAYTMIGYGTDLTGINKNLENLSTSIFNAFLESLRNPDTLFTNLPKKSDTGANITLNDTANAPMRITLGATELTQAGTPTPTTPYDIHTISGNNTIKVVGSQLWDEEWELGGINATTGQNSVSTTVIRSKNYIPVQPSTDYYYYNGTDAMWVFAYDKNKNFLGYATGSSSSVSNTSKPTPSECYYIRFQCRNQYGTTYLNNIMINKGTTALPYEPHQEQTAQVNLGDIKYCKIGNYEDKFIRTSGKNILPFNASDLTINQYISSSNGSEQTSTSGNFYGSFEYINFNYGGKTITLSDGLEVAFYDTSKTFISYVGRLLERTQIVPSNCKYIRIDCYKDNINNIQINLGDTLLPYEPYGSNEWYIKKNIGKAVFDGSESWILASTYYFSSPTVGDLTENMLYCNMATYITLPQLSQTTDNRIAPRVTSTQHKFWTRFSQFNNDVSAFNTYLSTNNMIVYYVKATPTYTQITGTLANQLENVYQKMQSQAGQTNISQVNNELSFELSVQAIENLD